MAHTMLAHGSTCHTLAFDAACTHALRHTATCTAPQPATASATVAAPALRSAALLPPPRSPGARSCSARLPTRPPFRSLGFWGSILCTWLPRSPASHSVPPITPALVWLPRFRVALPLTLEHGGRPEVMPGSGAPSQPMRGRRARAVGSRSGDGARPRLCLSPAGRRCPGVSGGGAWACGGGAPAA